MIRGHIEMSPSPDLSIRGGDAPSVVFDGRVAVVHEWVSAAAGSEKVFAALAQAFPQAALYALTREPSVDLEALADKPVTTTMLDRSFLRERRAALLPIMPLAWRRLRRSNYDLVISSSHAFARWFATPNDTMHLSYVHAPMRYAWNPEIDTRGAGANPLISAGRRMLCFADSQTTGRVRSFAANSTAVAERISKHYGRQSHVIPPPVDVRRFRGVSGTGGYLVSGGRLISYKRFDLAIAAAEQVGMPLVLFGTGPEQERLQALAASTSTPVEFVASPGDDELGDLLRNANAFLFPAIEDFGILPVEALAAGTPVVGVGRGGAVDIAGSSKCVELAADQSVHELALACERLLARDCSPASCRSRAAEFGPEAFDQRIKEWVAESLPSVLPDRPRR